jgi:hypothetical protein
LLTELGKAFGLFLGGLWLGGLAAGPLISVVRGVATVVLDWFLGLLCSL